MKRMILLFFVSLFVSLSAAAQQSPVEWLGKAMLLTRSGQHLDAILYCTYYIKSDSLECDAFYLRAYNYYMLGNYKLAQADATRAIDINPRSADNWLLRGRIRKSMLNYIGAFQDFRRARQLDPVKSLLYATKSVFSPVLPSGSSSTTTSKN